MTLPNRIREVVLNELSNNLSKCSYFLETDRRVLIALVSAGVITKADLLPIANKKLCVDGRGCYDRHIWSLKHGDNIMYPDHTFAPEAFAYALAHNVFSTKEESRIKFDHGDTKETFIAQYGMNMQCLHLVDSWLKPPNETTTSSSDSSCEGCPI